MQASSPASKKKANSPPTTWKNCSTSLTLTATSRSTDALQELTRLAVQTETGERSRLMLDIAGFRAERKEELRDITREAIARVRSTGEAVKLDAMNPFERKVCHDVVAEEGLTSESEGVEPHRRVVILPEVSDGE